VAADGKEAISQALSEVVADRFEVAEVDEDGDLMLLRDGASCVVWVIPQEGPDSRILEIFSIVVLKLDLSEAEQTFRALDVVNRLNQDARLGRWELVADAQSSDDSRSGRILFFEEIFLYGDQALSREGFSHLVSLLYESIDHLDDQILKALGSGELAVSEKGKQVRGNSSTTSFVLDD
jgi:hypothetical protein